MRIKDTLDPMQIEANTKKLIKAAGAGHHNTVQQLIPISDPDARLAEGGRSALMVALSEGRTKCAEALLPVSDLAASDTYSETLLMIAVKSKCAPSCLSPIIASSDIHARNGQGQTALHYAALAGTEDAIDKLLRAGADASARDHMECTPLHYAARVPIPPEKVERLLADPLCDPNAKNRFGATPLMDMASDGSISPLFGPFPSTTRAVEALASVSDFHAINPRGLSLLEACKGEKNLVEKLVVAYATARMERELIREATAGQPNAKIQRAPSRSL